MTHPTLLPSPTLIRIQPGTCAVDSHFPVIAPAEWENSSLLQHAVYQFRTELMNLEGKPLEKDQTKYFHPTSLRFTQRSMEHKDGYVLNINSQGIELSSENEEGIHYGLQTLRQLLHQYGNALPCLNIDDYPSLLIRGYSLDISRGKVPSLPTLFALIDWLELHKFNQLQLYVEDTFPFLLGSHKNEESCISKEELKQVDLYCQERGIELVPCIASFGHMYDALRTPQYSSLSEFPEEASRDFNFVERMLHHTINPLAEGSKDFIAQRISEFLSVFSSQKVNITADETFDLGRGQSIQSAKDLKKSAQPADLYVEYISWLCSLLSQQGRSVYMYADIPIKYPEMLSKLPQGVIFLNWDYLAHPNEHNVQLLAQEGCTQIVCPGVQTWNKLIPDLNSAWTNCEEICTYARENSSAGMIVTDWGDYGHINDIAMSIPGLAFAAECSWSSNPMPMEQVLDATFLEQASLPRIASALSLLLLTASQQPSFSWADIVQYRELSDTNKPELHPNHDVLFILGYPSNSSVPEARTRFLEERTKDYNSVNRSLQTLLSTLKEESLSEEETHSSPLKLSSHVFGIYLRGQILFNQLGTVLINPTDFSENELLALSHDLISWEAELHQRWLSTSKESEFFRLHDILGWYEVLLQSPDCASLLQRKDAR